MIRPTIVRPAGREPYVRMPLADWRKVTRSISMLEEQADTRLFDAAMARDEEVFPSALVDSLIHGDNPIKVWREYRGLTQAQLAAKIGKTAVYISMLETGRKRGSIATLRAIADVLRTDLDLIAPR